MNQIAPASEFALPQPLFDDATALANTWRGRCLDAFARAEAAVTECLAFLSQLPEGGDAVRRPLLVGQRFEALAAALSAAKARGVECDRAIAALESVRTQDRLRTMLCHGVGTIAIDRNGRWNLIMRISAFQSKQLVRDTFAVSEQEASDLRDNLIRASKSLCTQLSKLRAQLS